MCGLLRSVCLATILMSWAEATVLLVVVLRVITVVSHKFDWYLDRSSCVSLLVYVYPPPSDWDVLWKSLDCSPVEKSMVWNVSEFPCAACS